MLAEDLGIAILHLSNPSIALSGEVEDHANNSVYVVEKLKKIIDNMFYIFAMEMMHAGQAIDLRDNYRLGNRVQIAYDEIRKVVPFYDKDRPIYKC